MSVQSITWDMVVVAVAGILALLSAYNTYSTAKANRQKAQAERNAPTRSLEERVAAHDTMLASDKRRIEQLEARQSEHDEEMKLLLKSQLALLRHGIDGNNIEGLKACQKDIQEYLVDK